MIPDKIMLKSQPLYKPVIAAINGRALGGGTELIEATDIRIAADHAVFALPEPRVGVVPGPAPWCGWRGSYPGRMP